MTKKIAKIEKIENNQNQPKQSILLFIDSEQKEHKYFYRVTIKKDCIIDGEKSFAMDDEQKRLIKQWIAINAQNEKIKKQKEGYKKITYVAKNEDAINEELNDLKSLLASKEAEVEKIKKQIADLTEDIASGDIDAINAQRKFEADFKNRVAQSKMPMYCTLFDMLVKANQATSREDARENWITYDKCAFDENIYNALLTVVKMQYGIQD